MGGSPSWSSLHRHPPQIDRPWDPSSARPRRVLAKPALARRRPTRRKTLQATSQVIRISNSTETLEHNCAQISELIVLK